MYSDNSLNDKVYCKVLHRQESRCIKKTEFSFNIFSDFLAFRIAVVSALIHTYMCRIKVRGKQT